MIRRAKFPVSSLRGLVAGGILAGAVGLGITQAEDYGTPKSTPSGTPTEDQGGVGGSQGPGMITGETGLPPNVAPGWKIRVCSEKTKAQSINFKISTPEKKGASARSKTRDVVTETQDQATGMGEGSEQDMAATQGQSPEMATWNKGESSVISVPASFSSAERIRIEATPAEKDAKAEICVLYDDHVAKKLSFDDREVSTVKMTENGSCGC